MRDAEPEITRSVIQTIPDSLLLRLLDVRPSTARVGEVQPEQLLNAVGIAFGASPDALVKGIALLAENNSGNFAIDAPFDVAVYELLDGFAASDPDLVLRVFRETNLRLLPWVIGHAKEAAMVLGANLDRFAVLLVALDGPEPTPERIIRQLAYSDGETAAGLMLAILDVGRGDVMTGPLNTIVYDAYWSGLGAGPTSRLDSAGALLIALRDIVGENRTAGFIGEVSLITCPVLIAAISRLSTGHGTSRHWNYSRARHLERKTVASSNHLSQSSEWLHHLARDIPSIFPHAGQIRTLYRAPHSMFTVITFAGAILRPKPNTPVSLAGQPFSGALY
jgi:hypothetical protein